MEELLGHNIYPGEQPVCKIRYFNTNVKLPCYKVLRYRLNDYIFQVSLYDHNSNGRQYVKMFDRNGKQFLEDYTVYISYVWGADYNVVITNNDNPESENYKKIIKRYKEKNFDIRRERLFKQLININNILLTIDNQDSLIEGFFSELYKENINENE